MEKFKPFNPIELPPVPDKFQKLEVAGVPTKQSTPAEIIRSVKKSEEPLAKSPEKPKAGNKQEEELRSILAEEREALEAFAARVLEATPESEKEKVRQELGQRTAEDVAALEVRIRGAASESPAKGKKSEPVSGGGASGAATFAARAPKGSSERLKTASEMAMAKIGSKTATAEKKPPAGGEPPEKDADKKGSPEKGDKEKPRKEPKIDSKREEKEKEPPRDLTADEKRDVYSMLTGEEMDGKVPRKFEVPENVHREAAGFFDARGDVVKFSKQLLEAEAEFKKSGGDKGASEISNAKWYLENAQKTYKDNLERYKRELVAEKYRAKRSEFPERFSNSKDKKDELAGAAVSLMPAVAKYVDEKTENLLRTEMEKTQERGFVGKLWEKYKNTSRFNKILISTGLAAGIGAGVALGAGFGLAAATGIAGARAARSFGGGALGAGFNMIGQKLFGIDAVGEKRQLLDKSSEELKKDFLAGIERQQKMFLKDKKGKGMALYELLDESASGYFNGLKGIDAKDAKRRGLIMLVSGVAGGLTAAGVDQFLHARAEDAALAAKLATANAAHGGNMSKMAAMAAEHKIGLSADETILEAKESPWVTTADKLNAGAATDGAVETAVNYTETAKAGDSVWKLAKHQLAEHYGDKFSGLSEAQKTYLIDAIKDKIAADPTQFGLENADKLAVGQEVDFSSVFNDKDLMEGVFGHADKLTAAQAAHILENNEQIAAWHAGHPHETLTSDKVAEIFGGKAEVGANLPSAENIMRVPTDIGAPVSVETAGGALSAKGELLQEIASGNFGHVPPETMTYVDGVTQAHLQEIYGAEKVSGWFSSGDNKYWQAWEAIKGRSAQNIINASGPTDAAFGAPKFGDDATELGDRIELRDYLRKLSSATPAHGGESVLEFIKRGEMVKGVGSALGGSADSVPLPKQFE